MQKEPFILLQGWQNVWYSTQVQYGMHQFWEKSMVRKTCGSTGTGMLVHFLKCGAKRTNLPYQKVSFRSL